METGENNTTLIKTSNFNIDLSEQYHLSIEIDLYTFTFCVLDIKTLTYVYLEKKIYNKNQKKYSHFLASIINNNEILNSKFSSISISFSGFPNSLIPKSLYDKKYVKKVLNLHTNSSDNIFTNDLYLHEAKIIYAIPEEITTTINTFFPTAYYNCSENILISQYTKLKKAGKTNYIDVKKDSINITILDGERLLLNNTYKFLTKEDFLYYILYSFEQLNLITEKDPVVLSGDISEKDENYKIIYQYIKNINFINRPKQISFPNEFKSIKEHQYFGLFGQVLCE